MHKCSQCDKTFKTPRSRASHTYRYHPYSKKLVNKIFDKSEDIETSTTISETSSVNNNYDELLDRRIDSNKFDIELLNSELSCLRKLVYDLDIKMLFQCNAVENIKHKTNHGDIKTPTSMSHKENTAELLLIKDQNRNTSQRISAIENKLDDVIGNIQDEHAVATEDVIYDMTEIKNLFVEHNYDKILSDIPKLQQSVKLVLHALDMTDITDEGIELLEKLSDSSKVTTRKLVKDNFGHLVSIFTKLKPAFDDVYEDMPNEPDETDSEDGSEHESSRSNASGDETDSDGVYEDMSNEPGETDSEDGSEHESSRINDSGDETDSESDTDSEASVQSGESGSEREQSETVTESKDNDAESRDDAGTDKEYETYP